MHKPQPKETTEYTIQIERQGVWWYISHIIAPFDKEDLTDATRAYEKAKDRYPYNSIRMIEKKVIETPLIARYVEK